MDLMLNRTSPFARVARISAIERGLADRVQLHWVDPWTDDPALLEATPVGRVPVLRTDSGRCITEALLIAAHLDRHGVEGAPLFPDDDGTALETAGLAQGLMEAAFATVIGRKHHGPESDDTVLGRRRHAAMARTLDHLDALAAAGAARRPLDIGAIGVGVAVAYLHFRLPEIAVAERQPALARWCAILGDRPSFRETAFA